MRLKSHFRNLLNFLASFFSHTHGKVCLAFLILGLLCTLFVDASLTIELSQTTHSFRKIWKILTYPLFPPLYIIIPPVALLLIRFYLKGTVGKFHPLTFTLTFALCSSTAIVRILKVLIGRGRPTELLKHGVQLFHPFSFNDDFYSLPSGHVISAFTLASTLSLLWPRFRPDFLILAFLLSLSRVALMDHFLSDLFFTAAIGIVISWLCFRAVSATTGRDEIWK